MERTVSTIDKNSSDFLMLEDFDKLDPINVKDLRVLIFMKNKKEIVPFHTTQVIAFLQGNFNIKGYVTEEVLQLIKEINKSDEDDTETEQGTKEESKSKGQKVDIDKLETFTSDNQTEINRIVTVGGDGTVVQAIKLFYKQKCPGIISFGEESLGYLGGFEIEQYKEVLYNTLIKIAPDAGDFMIDSLEQDFGLEDLGQPYVEKRQRVVLKASFDVEDKSIKSSFNPNTK